MSEKNAAPVGLHPGQVTPSGVQGVGGYRPRRIVDNAELAKKLGVSPAWIEQRSGIRVRRYAAPDETLTRMATAAADQALTRADVAAKDIDLVLLASTSNTLMTPPTAVQVAHELGSATGIDPSAACAGFCHDLGMASDAVRGGDRGAVLVIGAERMTDIVDPQDQEISFLFADGAGAVVVGATERPGIGPAVRGADGRYFDALTMSSGWDAYAADPAGRVRPWLRMDGGKVFRWAMNTVCPAAGTVLRAAGTEAGRLDAFIPHQANLRITRFMAERLKLSEDTVVSRDVTVTGNTSSASIPLVMDALLENRGGAPSAAAPRSWRAGFGAGLNYAGQVVRLP